jgi:hypothetical protein
MGGGAALGALSVLPGGRSIGGEIERAAEPEIADALRGGITAYHGSGADFSRFDPAKIGTGEGNQAFGHGFYGAQNEEVAQNYRDQLAAGPRTLIDGGPFDPNNVDHQAAKYMSTYGRGNPQRAAAMLKGDIAWGQRTGQDTGQLQAIMDRMKAGDLPTATTRPGGHMYQLNINAQPEHLLDYDAPLSEQGGRVQDFMASNPDLMSRVAAAHGREFKAGSQPTGQTLLETMAGGPAMKDAQGASQTLDAAGIPGIQYYDEQSRLNRPRQLYNGQWQIDAATPRRFDTQAAAQAAYDKTAADMGARTRNYVVFNPDNIEILKKYGLAGGLIGSGALAASAGAQPQQQAQQVY